MSIQTIAVEPIDSRPPVGRKSVGGVTGVEVIKCAVDIAATAVAASRTTNEGMGVKSRDLHRII